MLQLKLAVWFKGKTAPFKPAKVINGSTWKFLSLGAKIGRVVSVVISGSLFNKVLEKSISWLVSAKPLWVKGSGVCVSIVTTLNLKSKTFWVESGLK